MNKDELKEHSKNAEDPKDDGIETQNIGMDLPSGIYNRIAMQGKDFNLDICCPATGGMTFGQLVDQAVYLAIFSSDDDVKDIVRKSLLKSLNKPEGEVNKE